MPLRYRIMFSAALFSLALVCYAAIGSDANDGDVSALAISVKANGEDTASIPDFDGDGTIGFGDFVIFAGVFGARQGDEKYDATYDLNDDGEIGFSDFVIFAENFGKDVPSPAVAIPDANLSAAIETALGKASDAPITRAEMATLDSLAASDADITDLTGLEYAVNLTWLDLASNDITNISVLADLTNLTHLILSSNNITDLAGLAANTSLGAGGTVDVTDNPLNAESLSTHVPTLQARGVRVSFTPSPPPSSPDLIVKSPSVSDSTLTPGQSFTLSATVRNQGTGAAAATTLRYYRSTNRTISIQDSLVGSDAVSSLAASGASAVSISLTAPSSEGAYYYGVCVASVTGESNTRNNCSGTSVVTVWDRSRVVKLLEEVGAQNPEEYAALAALSWIQDGVSASESYAVSTLTEAALLTDKVFSALLEKPWIRDGLSADEAFMIEQLVRIARRTGRKLSVESTLRILEMPFIDTFETLDYYAVRCLNFLDVQMDGRYLQQVLDHPSLSGGITDKDTVILAGLWRIARFSPENVESRLILLDPDQVYLQERTIALPLAGETTLTVLRVTPGTFRTIDMMEEILRQYEAFMNVAYPYNMAAIFNVNSGGPRASAGQGIVTLHQGYEEDVYLLTHELAHAYWHIPSAWWQAAYSKGITFTPFTWIAEGAATFLDVTFVVDIRTDSLRNAPAWPSDTGCSLFDTIGELDQKTYTASPDKSLEGGALYRSSCNYNMGYGLFADLYKRLGDTEFRKGFGSLYLKMSNLEHDDVCTGVERGVCYVRKAFVEDASPGFAEAADEVINRWYYGGEPF